MKKDLWIILTIIFIGLVGFGIVIPTLPFVAERFGGGPMAIGLLMASYSFFQFIAAPVLGQLSDRYGRRPILVISLIGSAAGFFLIAPARSLAWIFASRIIDGATGGNISVAQAYIADITDGEERARAMGLIGAAFGLGFIFGPLLGAALSPFGFAAPYIFAGFLSLAAAIATGMSLVEPAKRKTAKTGLFLNPKSIRLILRPKLVFDLTLLIILSTFAFSLLQGILPIFTQTKFLWQEKENGLFFALIGLVLIITQGFLIKRLTGRLSHSKLVAISLALMALAYLFLGSGSGPVLFLVAGSGLAFAFGVFNTISQAEVSLLSPADKQGLVLGTVQGVNALARAAGPLAGGFLFAKVSPASPFLLSSFLFVLAAVFAIKIYRPPRRGK